MKNKYIKWSLWPISLIVLILISSNSPYFISDKEYFETVTEFNKVTAVQIPKTLDFAGESVPLDRFYVRESLEREMTVNTYWHSSSILLIKRAHRWFPVIEPILKKYGIPDDFKYLSVAESGLTNIVSPAGATGFWQIMKATAREYDLEVNSGVDERYHVEKSTKVACQYLLDAYEKYGSWTMAAASYNAGMNKISKEIERQNENDYYDMNFGQETGRYMYRILALKQVLSNPKEFGFHLRDTDLYKPYETKVISIDTTINDLSAFAHSYGLNYRELKIYNPWMRQAFLPDESRRIYKIKIPVGATK
jgi:hypothetical protein